MPVVEIELLVMKRKQGGAFISLAAFFISCFTITGESTASSVQGALPPDALEAFSRFPASKQYVFVSHVKPSYLQADFNGDRKADTAVLVKHESTGKIGIAIIHGDSSSVMILGAGRHFGNGGDDFVWMDEWRIYPKGTVAKGVGGAVPPVLKGDGVLVIKTMAASALIYWTGQDYGWYQQGD
jgi:hypothetical protein